MFYTPYIRISLNLWCYFLKQHCIDFGNEAAIILSFLINYSRSCNFDHFSRSYNVAPYHNRYRASLPQRRFGASNRFRPGAFPSKQNAKVT